MRRTNLTNYEQRMYFWDPDDIQIVHKGYSNYHSCVYIENETSQALCRLLFRQYLDEGLFSNLYIANHLHPFLPLRLTLQQLHLPGHNTIMIW